MKKSKNIVVTGGNAGIGLETVRALYEDGHNLIFGSRNQQNNENAAKDITQKQGGTLKHFKLDLSKRASIDEFAKNVRVIRLIFRDALMLWMFLSIMLELSWMKKPSAS